MESFDVEARAKVFAALADPNRLRVIEILAGEEELCGTDIARRAGISMALLSHHWRILTEAGLVVRERRGQRQYCRVDRDALEAAFAYVWPQRRRRSTLPREDR
ncbi:MAG TPA: metalloregulator ArsR/SmtB family transcription factor [Fimbriimonadaceae bacterium]|nr:metalloregulator ArsR/SmtB family transcription factor [Fimbriimonadaceae bacterium]